MRLPSSHAEMMSSTMASRQRTKKSSAVSKESSSPPDMQTMYLTNFCAMISMGLYTYPRP